ncbi:root allergen protein-like protein [Tanacetum coccineum]
MTSQPPRLEILLPGKQCAARQRAVSPGSWCPRKGKASEERDVNRNHTTRSFAVKKFELSSSLPASKLFKAYDDFENVAPKVDPETYKALVTVEGDGGVGTIRDVHFGDGMPFKIGKAKLDVVDKENYAISYTTYEGDVLMGILDSTTHHIKFTPSADGGCVYKQTVVYNCKDDTPLAEEYLNIAKEALKKTFKAIESHIHANPHAY